MSQQFGNQFLNLPQGSTPAPSQGYTPGFPPTPAPLHIHQPQPIQPVHFPLPASPVLNQTEQEDRTLGELGHWLPQIRDEDLQPRAMFPEGLPALPQQMINSFRAAFAAGRRAFQQPNSNIEPKCTGRPSVDNCIWEYYYQGFRYSELTHFRHQSAFQPVQQPAPPVTEAVQQPQNHRVTKLAEPDAFYGDTKKCKDFLTQLALHFSNDPRAYDKNDAAKLTKAISYMRGNAGTWASQFIDPSTGHIKTIPYEDFVSRLKAAFGDPDEIRTAERQLDALRQTSSCSAYVAQFVALASLLPNWEQQKEAYLLKFRKGLKKEIKDMLLYQLDEPKEFEKFANFCIRLDNKLHAHQAELRQGSHQSSSSSVKKSSGSTSSPASTSSGTAPGPMELDAARSKKRGKLTEKERKYRRENNLCSYCGGDGHYASACPVKATRGGNNKGKPKQGAANIEVAPNATVKSESSESGAAVQHQAAALYQVSEPKN